MAMLKALAFLALVSLAAAARMPEPSWQQVAETVEEGIREGGHSFEVSLLLPCFVNASCTVQPDALQKIVGQQELAEDVPQAPTHGPLRAQHQGN